MISKLHHKIIRARSIHCDFGTAALLQHTVNILAGPICDFEALEILWLDADDAVVPSPVPDGMEARFLAPCEVAAFAHAPENGLTDSLVQRAYAETDRCFGIVSNGQLASYTWYATPEEVAADDFGLRKRVPSATAYMHNAFTPVAWRGLRLYGIGVASALRELNRQGITSLLTDIDWSNHASRRGCRRAGFQSLGILYTFGRSKFRFSIRPGRARDQQVTFRRAALDRTASKESISLDHAPPTQAIC